jgi:uncharacterized RDD family membrane protein YckC
VLSVETTAAISDFGLVQNSSMSCPTCGLVCTCLLKTNPEHYLRPESDSDAIQPSRSSQWIDPEAYDASEQRFAASLEMSESSQQKFVAKAASESSAQVQPPLPATDSSSANEMSVFEGYQDPDAWKQELAAKLNEYRSRRQPRAPRYPSLQLKFDAQEAGWIDSPVQDLPPGTFARQSSTFESTATAPALEPEAPSNPAARPGFGPPEPTGRILEFPRAASIPSSWVNELAEPVMERPRILDVPEVAPPPPALGGILIEPVLEPEDEKRPGIEIPMLAAEMWRRLLAGLLDGVFVATAVALFGYIFVKMTGLVPEIRPAVIGCALLTSLFWFGYQYLLIVHSGTTLGLKVAGLELSRFDGTTVPRRLRRWRVLASALSGASLCLGYLWSFLDEDQLCWHDRITKTYMAPKP